MNSQIRLREILEDSCPQCDRGTVLDGYDNASCGEMIHNEAFLDQAEQELIQWIESLIPEEATADFVYFDEDKYQGWTKEQLRERVWGYNQCRTDIRNKLSITKEGKDE